MLSIRAGWLHRQSLLFRQCMLQNANETAVCAPHVKPVARGGGAPVRSERKLILLGCNMLCGLWVCA